MALLGGQVCNHSTVARLIARCAELLSNYLSQRFIDSVLPTRPGVLKVIKNVPVNSQRDKLLSDASDGVPRASWLPL